MIAIWHFRGFEFARKVEKKNEADKDQEYQSRLEKLLKETEGNGGIKEAGWGKELRAYA